MTGTAMTEADEFWKIYKLDVVADPDEQAAAAASNTRTSSTAPTTEKWDAVVDEVEEVHKTRPADPDRHDRRREEREAVARCSSAAASSTSC